MLVLSKLLVRFGIYIIIVSLFSYAVGYLASGNIYLRYYPTSLGNSRSSATFAYIQNGSTTLKYFGIFFFTFGAFSILLGEINERFKFSARLYRYHSNEQKREKPKRK